MRQGGAGVLALSLGALRFAPSLGSIQRGARVRKATRAERRAICRFAYSGLVHVCSRPKAVRKAIALDFAKLGLVNSASGTRFVVTGAGLRAERERSAAAPFVWPWGVSRFGEVDR